jgi:uncharacterized protein (DUF924 family)
MTLQPSDILEFWFENDPSIHQKKWFEKDQDFDVVCANFVGAIRDARSGAYDHWALTPEGGLALIILLDQLSRNVFRGSPEAFAADPRAREIARGMIDAGFDTKLTANERMFVYLPFEHSETLEDQDESVRLFALLLDELGPDTVAYAQRHHDVIREFGRFLGGRVA